MRAVIFDVENSSRAEYVDRLLTYLDLRQCDGQTRLVAIGNWTVESGTFANNAQSFYFDKTTPPRNQHTFTNLDAGEYWIVAKMTWVRPHNRDWNTKMPAAHCQFTAG